MKIALFDSAWKYTLETPYNEPLGGTQSAICYFIEEMHNKNHNIYLFNNIDNEIMVKGVNHIPVSQYDNYIKKNQLSFDLVIISCLVHDLFQIKHTLNNPSTMYCLWTGHDINQNASQLLKDTKAKDMVDLFIFVSEWQRNRYIETYNIEYNKTIILRNGIGKPFEKYLNLPINKINKSMTYCSIPWRGINILPLIYNKLKQNNKDASLKIYSGMNIYKQKTSDDDISKDFLKLDDVVINEGISQNKLADNLYNIEYLTYPNTFPETSCITVLQAMACGCIVVTSNLGALKETMNNMNFYVDINPYNFDVNKYVDDFVVIMNNLFNLNQEFKNKYIEQNRDYIKKNYTWNVICNNFEKEILPIIINFRKYVENDNKSILNNFIKLFTEQKWVDACNETFKIKYNLSLNEYVLIKLNLGVCYYQLGKLDKAKESFKICLELKNDNVINKNIALLELQKNNITAFIKYARQSLAHTFDIELSNLLAEKYELIGHYNDAIGLYKTIIFLDPKNINAFNNLGNLYLLKISQLDNFNELMDKTYNESLRLCVKFNQERKKELVLSNIIFNNLYNWRLSNEEIFEKSCVWYDYFPKQKHLLNITNRLNRKNFTNKIRIGYISCDFITHPVGFMFDSILKNHNTNNFEIFCYDCCDPDKSKNDLISNKLRVYNNAKWITITNTNDDDALNIIVNDNLDILVDMMGHTRNTRMNLLQYKPAKIIISYFAYPSTNGLNEIDYRFTDKYATPPECQKYFKEKLYYLPNGFQCYTPPVELNGDKNYNRDKYKINLCCFNNPIKLSIPTINTFTQILKRLPESKLYLRYCYYKSSYYRETIYKLFTDRGIDRDRVDIGYENIVDALKFYNNMDIALDPYPYNGGTISSECIYMNTPFITLEGKTYVSRVGVSLLSNLGLEKYIAKTEEEYINKVINLARNQNELRDLHKNLRIKMLNSDLANSKTFTTNIENAYTNIVNMYKNNI